MIVFAREGQISVVAAAMLGRATEDVWNAMATDFAQTSCPQSGCRCGCSRTTADTVMVEGVEGRKRKRVCDRYYKATRADCGSSGRMGLGAVLLSGGLLVATVNYQRGCILPARDARPLITGNDTATTIWACEGTLG
jgi:hypothetical protein